MTVPRIFYIRRQYDCPASARMSITRFVVFRLSLFVLLLFATQAVHEINIQVHTTTLIKIRSSLFCYYICVFRLQENFCGHACVETCFRVSSTACTAHFCYKPATELGNLAYRAFPKVATLMQSLYVCNYLETLQLQTGTLSLQIILSVYFKPVMYANGTLEALLPA